MSGLSEREKAIRQRLKDDFEHYSAKCLKIRPKHLEGEAQPGLIPFRLNAVQQRLHARIEDQRARTGRVRILALKARQPGVSTYAASRYFWKVTHHRGIRVFVLTHSDKATANLFAIAKTYYEHFPGLIRPQIKASNAKELSFSRLNSGYSVGTAKAVGRGRSETIQLFHGSEVVFWANVDEHAASALQTAQVSCLRAFDLAEIERSEQASNSGAGAGGSEAAPAVRAGRDEERQAENRDS